MNFENNPMRLPGPSDNHTATEIFQQPELWSNIYKLVVRNKQEILAFMERATEKADQIILTGAGTSAFIGNSLASDFCRQWGIPAHAVSSTDMVTHPGNYFNNKERILLISFGRSGNSPESCAVVELAEKLAAGCDHLVITCDPEGSLVKKCKVAKKHIVVLPEEANDKSLAMTSSYTGMMLAGLLISRIRTIQQEEMHVRSIISYGTTVLTNYLPGLMEVSKLDFKRAVFLGSGPLRGTATESHLKLQELTDGHIMCKADSYLGFRHGPKAVTDPSALIVYLFSNNPHVLQYERDLVKSMKKGQKAMFQIGVMESAEVENTINADLDLVIRLSEKESRVDEEYLAICEVLPAQILGLLKSVGLGFHPDNPSKSGAISRVVEGVNIYSYA